jgi:hypothetical protein
MKAMSTELYLGIIVEAPLWLTFLPWVLVEVFVVYPHKPDPVSSSEGMRMVG